MIETIYSDPNFLAHHGVKGMKWGVRHDEPSTSSGGKKTMSEIHRERVNEERSKPAGERLRNAAVGLMRNETTGNYALDSRLRDMRYAQQKGYRKTIKQTLYGDANDKKISIATNKSKRAQEMDNAYRAAVNAKEKRKAQERYDTQYSRAKLVRGISDESAKKWATVTSEKTPALSVKNRWYQQATKNINDVIRAEKALDQTKNVPILNKIETRRLSRAKQRANAVLNSSGDTRLMDLVYDE